jgi:hypothetical protein
VVFLDELYYLTEEREAADHCHKGGLYPCKRATGYYLLRKCYEI